MIKTQRDAIKLYNKLRRELSGRKKRKAAFFEGQRFFRFGNSWRRISLDRTKTVILNDDSEKLLFIRS